ncbi:MAG: CARDB domain-containing protein [Patescibacteria group bacterium]|nr:hypothetical protein [Patescibacteria group bacterium]
MANKIPGVSPSAPKKSKKKLIIAGIIATLLIVALVIGNSLNMLGAFRIIGDLEDGYFAEDYETSPKCKYKADMEAYFCVDGCHYFVDFYMCDGNMYQYEELPDLEITDAYVQDDGRIWFMVENAGGEEVVSSYQNAYGDVYAVSNLTGTGGVLTSTYFYSDFYPQAFEAGGSRSGTLYDGYYSFEVCADYQEYVEESDETNNCMELEIPVMDLQITDASLQQDGTLTFTVTNTGDRDVESSHPYIGGEAYEISALTGTGSISHWTYFYSDQTPWAFEAGSSATGTFYGAKAVAQVCADYNGYVEEGDENNNCRGV